MKIIFFKTEQNKKNHTKKQSWLTIWLRILYKDISIFQVKYSEWYAANIQSLWKLFNY